MSFHRQRQDSAIPLWSQLRMISPHAPSLFPDTIYITTPNISHTLDTVQVDKIIDSRQSCWYQRTTLLLIAALYTILLCTQAATQDEVASPTLLGHVRPCAQICTDRTLQGHGIYICCAHSTDSIGLASQTRQSTDCCTKCESMACAGQFADCPNPYFADTYIYTHFRWQGDMDDCG